MAYKDYMIQIIRNYQYYETGILEAMTEEEVSEIYENLLDWIG